MAIKTLSAVSVCTSSFLRFLTVTVTPSAPMSGDLLGAGAGQRI